MNDYWRSLSWFYAIEDHIVVFLWQPTERPTAYETKAEWHGALYVWHVWNGLNGRTRTRAHVFFFCDLVPDLMIFLFNAARFVILMASVTCRTSLFLSICLSSFLLHGSLDGFCIFFATYERHGMYIYMYVCCAFCLLRVEILTIVTARTSRASLSAVQYNMYICLFYKVLLYYIYYLLPSRKKSQRASVRASIEDLVFITSILSLGTGDMTRHGVTTRDGAVYSFVAATSYILSTLTPGLGGEMISIVFAAGGRIFLYTLPSWCSLSTRGVHLLLRVTWYMYIFCMYVCM